MYYEMSTYELPCYSSLELPKSVLLMLVAATQISFGAQFRKYLSSVNSKKSRTEEFALCTSANSMVNNKKVGVVYIDVEALTY